MRLLVGMGRGATGTGEGAKQAGEAALTADDAGGAGTGGDGAGAKRDVEAEIGFTAQDAAAALMQLSEEDARSAE